MTTVTHFPPPSQKPNLKLELDRLSKTFTEYQQWVQDLVREAYSTPEGEERHAVVQQCRAAILDTVSINWEVQRVQALIAQEIPAWEITDALHHPVLDRYGFIRLEGITDDQYLVLESFDQEGNGKIERLAMLDFQPAGWEVIGRNVYEQKLNELLEQNLLTWK